MARPWRRKGRSTEEGEHLTRALSVEEAAAVRAQQAPPSRAYPADIPLGGTTKQNPGYQGQTDRRAFMDELYGAYLACPWSSRCVDVIAETITAGGLEIAPEDDLTDDGEQPKPPAEIVAAQQLLDFVNPREDARQIARGGLQDLGIFGDAFYEIVWFAGRPVAIYSLDAPSMIPLADEHGTITGFAQVLDPNRQVDFEPHEVIHISLDAPRGSVYGVGPTQKNLIPITAWLFTAGLLKETMRKGNPRDLHVDYPLEVDQREINRQRDQYMVRNLGIQNIGMPFVTRGGATTKELGQNQIAEYLETLNQKRDEILSGYGVPPAQVGVIESGNLGGGTGTSQEKNFRVNTCGPKAEAFLEKITFHLIREAFGIDGWRARFGDVDWRDDKVIEEIRDSRIRNATWTVNRARQDVGEPPIDGGDVAVLVDRQNMVVVGDLADYSKAAVAALRAKGEEGDATDLAKAAGVDPAMVPAKPGAPAKESVATPSGVMVAFYPPAELAASLAVADGLDPADLHLTLAYLGPSSDLADREALEAVVRAWALQTAPMQLTLSGLGVFTTDDTPVTYASVDGPDLPAARQRLVDALSAAGLPVSTTHGFTPHITLAYADVVGAATRPAGSFAVGSVALVIDGERVEFPLTGTGETADAGALAEQWRRIYARRREQALAELA